MRKAFLVVVLVAATIYIVLMLVFFFLKLGIRAEYMYLVFGGLVVAAIAVMVRKMKKEEVSVAKGLGVSLLRVSFFLVLGYLLFHASLFVF